MLWSLKTRCHEKKTMKVDKLDVYVIIREVGSKTAFKLRNWKLANQPVWGMRPPGLPDRTTCEKALGRDQVWWLKGLELMGLVEEEGVDIEVFRNKPAKTGRTRPWSHLEASQRLGWTLADVINGLTRASRNVCPTFAAQFFPSWFCMKTGTNAHPSRRSCCTVRKLSQTVTVSSRWRGYSKQRGQLPMSLLALEVTCLSQINSCSNTCLFCLLNLPDLFWSSHLPLLNQI